MSSHPDLSGRTALVTGAASGIGEACARRLAAAGARVVVLDRSAEAAAEVAGDIGADTLVVDLADPDAIDTALDGLDVPIDILVNNAGLQHVAPIGEFPTERWDTIIAVMLTAPFRLARRLVPAMAGRGWGRIINVSSAHGHRASPFKSAYVSAKHGLEGLSKVIALEGGRPRCHVQLHRPGLRPHRVGRGADRRPGPRPRDQRRRGRRDDHAGRHRRQAADRAHRGR